MWIFLIAAASNGKDNFLSNNLLVTDYVDAKAKLHFFKFRVWT